MPPRPSSLTAEPLKGLRLQQLVLQSSPFPAGCLCGPQGLAQVLGMFTLWLRRIFPPRGGLWEKAQKKCVKNPSNFPSRPWPLIC